MCFQFVFRKVIQSNVVVVSCLCFGRWLNVWLLECVCGFVGALQTFVLYIVSRECILPLSFDCVFQFVFSKVIESNVVFLYFDCALARGWMCVLGTIPNSVWQMLLFLHAYLPSCIRPHPYLRIPDHSCPPHSHHNPMHDIPGIFPAIHTQNMHICTHPYPQVPFLIVLPLQHPPKHPTHPSTPIPNHNCIHIHHTRNM